MVEASFAIFFRTYVFLIVIGGHRVSLGHLGVVSLSIGLTGWLLGHVEVDTSESLPWLLLKNGLAGVLLGFPIRVILEVFVMAARMVDVSRGAQAGEQYSQQLEMSATLLERLAYLFPTLVFLEYNYHHVIIGFLRNSFSDVSKALTWELLRLSADGIEQALLIAAPVVLLILMLDIATAVAARMLPKFPAFFEFLPLKLCIGLLGLYLIFSAESQTFCFENFLVKAGWV